MTVSNQSWIESANHPTADFTLANLPLGVIEGAGDDPPCIAVPIGDRVLNLGRLAAAKVLDGVTAQDACALHADSLNDFAALGRDASRRLRSALQSLLAAGNDEGRNAVEASGAMSALADAVNCMPFRVGDYTDFYASKHHASNVGRMFRPDGDPLLPNWKHLPVGYHGRASSIVASGTPIRRPNGQTIAADGVTTAHGPCRLLDYELEVGFFIGKGTEMGDPVAIESALDHVCGLVLVNDWSARDIQKWEYQPLGPFNAKNFATTVSPWLVTMEALEPFMVAGPSRDEDDPKNLDYLSWKDDVLVDLKLEVSLMSADMRAKGMDPKVLSVGNYLDMYWSIAQMVAHHTHTGCNLNAGDMMASGTVSGPEESSRGCLLELTWRGEQPVELPDGTSRKFLQDGDELIIRGWCEREGHDRIGFGSCTGTVIPAH